MYIITQGGGTVIYDNVKKLCDQKGISIWRLERDLGFSNRSVSKWNDNEPGIRKVGVERKGVREVVEVVLTVGCWVLGAVCVLVMKKIEPNNKIYPVWALFISLVFTLFAFYEKR